MRTIAIDVEHVEPVLEGGMALLVLLRQKEVDKVVVAGAGEGEGEGEGRGESGGEVVRPRRL